MLRPALSDYSEKPDPLTSTFIPGIPVIMSETMRQNVWNRLFPFSGLPRPVYVLFVARIINRMGDFVRFFLTLYLTRILDMDPAEAGLVVTASALAGLAGGLASGRLSDLIGRKRMMLLAQSASASVLIVCGFSPDAVWLPYALILSQFFFGAIRPPSQALLTDLTPVEDRRKAFSLLYFGINIGVALGPLIAGFLFESYRRIIFWGDAATTFVGVVLVALLVPEPDSETVHRGDVREDADSSGSLKAFFNRPILVGFAAVMVINNFIYAQTHFSLPLLVDHLFGENGAKSFGLLMSVNAVTVLVFTPILLHLFSQDRPGRNMIWGGLSYALGFGCLAFIPESLGWILFSTVIWTLGEVIFATNARVFSAAYTPLNHRGRFASIEQMSWGLGAVLSPAVAGWLTRILGARGIWYPVLGLSLIVMLALAVLDARDRDAGIRAAGNTLEERTNG